MLETFDPKTLEAYGNLGATAIMGLAFLLCMFLVARNFMKVLKLHTEEKKDLLSDHREERKTINETMQLMQLGTNQALHGVEKAMVQVAETLRQVDCRKYNQVPSEAFKSKTHHG